VLDPVGVDPQQVQPEKEIVVFIFQKVPGLLPETLLGRGRRGACLLGVGAHALAGRVGDRLPENGDDQLRIPVRRAAVFAARHAL